MVRKAEGGGTQRSLYIDVLRVIAMLCVIFNHTSSDGFFLFAQYNPKTISFWSSGFFTVFCKVGVPLFFSLSGALLLSTNNITSKKHYQRIIRIAVVLIVVSGLYYIRERLTYHYPMSFEEFAKRLYSYRIMYHLWYLYDYIVFLITLPFLKGIAQQLTGKKILALILIAIAFQGVIPTVEFIVFNNDFTIYSHLKPSWLLESIVLYPLIGYYLHNRIERISKKTLFILWGLNIFLILFTVLLTYIKSEQTGVLDEANSQGFLSCFVVVNVVTVYLTIQKWFLSNHADTVSGKLIKSAGICTFGIYLIHPAIIDVPIRKDYFNWVTNVGMNSLIASFVFVIVLFAFCWGITWLLKKVPLIGKYV